MFCNSSPLTVPVVIQRVTEITTFEGTYVGRRDEPDKKSVCANKTQLPTFSGNLQSPSTRRHAGGSIHHDPAT
jgi:hypothetical protein